MPLSISVVIPAYNRAKTISRCLDSVLSQTFRSLEVIVVDDCSTDDTAEIVRSYRDPSVRCVVLERNSGAQAARNRGIQESKGEWIAFQDSDDEWLPEKLERQVAALSALNFDPLTVLHTNAFSQDPSGKRSRIRLPRIEGDGAYLRLLTMPAPMFPGMLVSRKALDLIGLLDEQAPSFQEWDTAIRLARICRFVYLPEPLFVYHLHTGETISKSSRRDIEGYQYIVDKFRDEIISMCGEESYDRHLSFNALKAVGWGLQEEAFAILRKRRGPSLAAHVIGLLARVNAGKVLGGLLVKIAHIMRLAAWTMRPCKGRTG